MNETNDNSSNGKTMAYVLGGAVYLGVVILTVALTINFVVGILPAEAYFMRGVMSMGVVLIGLNSIALPVALHYWAVSGWHRGTAIALYALDMLIMAFNLITSFSTLLGNAPAWVLSYEPYSVAMFIFALATWGILWMTDPGEKARVAKHQARQAFEVKAILKAATFLDSEEGMQAIADEARRLLPDIISPTTKRIERWGVSVPVSPERKDLPYQSVVDVNPNLPVSQK
jgi:hypothetical protein